MPCRALCSLPFSKMRRATSWSLDYKTSLIQTICLNTAELHMFPDIMICIPQARLARPLSKDGYLTIKWFLATLAGHQLNLARMVTGGRTTASGPSLLHVNMAAFPAWCWHPLPPLKHLELGQGPWLCHMCGPGHWAWGMGVIIVIVEPPRTIYCRKYLKTRAFCEAL